MSADHGSDLRAFSRYSPGFTLLDDLGRRSRPRRHWKRDGSTACKALASGLVGGIVSVAGGGHFASGFLAAGFATLAAPSVAQINSQIGGTLASREMLVFVLVFG